MTAVLLVAAACSAPRASTPQGPATTAASTAAPTAAIPPAAAARTELDWLIAAMAQLPVSEADVRAHFNTVWLETVDTAALNQWLQEVNQ